MQAHTLDKVLDLDSKASTLDDVVSAFQSSTLDEFGELLLSMPSQQFPNLSCILPLMTSDEIQKHWTGSSGVALLQQSVYIINTITSDYERITGQSIRNAQVLDFGCGWGRLLRLMLYFIPRSQLNGCDAWENSLEFCREARIPVRLEKSDTLPKALPFQEKTFDLIYAFSIFTHLSERATKACLEAFHSALRPNGICVITVRPKEFWETTKDSRSADQTQALLAAHDSRGFAFTPAATIDHYGDTSISKLYLEQQFPNWRIVKMGRTLIDPLQVIVWMRPAL